MKRSPIKRSDPDKIRAWQAKSRRTAARNRMRTTEQSESWQAVKEGVQVRARGLCEIVGPTCTTRGTEGHHRLPRSKGGRDVPSNTVWTCASCHQHVHGHPRWATELGFLEGVVR